jgi:glycosyltransferase involved in cell wall biosynthesis
MTHETGHSPKDAGTQLSVVMGTLNEEKAIAKVVNDIRRVAPQAEIVVVDSSTDQTAEIAASAGCVVVKQFPPKGYSPALHTAFTTASRDIVVTMDCDDTYPVEAIPILLEKIDQGYDVVSASRLGKRPQSMPVQNYIANVVFAKTAKILCGVESSDVHTGMRAYRRSMLRKLPYDPTNTLAVESQVSAGSLGYRLAEIFIDYHERIGGESKLHPIKGTIGTFQILWKWRRFCNRMRASALAEKSSP